MHTWCYVFDKADVYLPDAYLVLCFEYFEEHGQQKLLVFQIFFINTTINF